MSMKEKFRLFLRKGGMYYAENVDSRKQSSLGTKDRKEALRLLHAKNEAHRQPSLNLQMGQAYLSAADPEILKRDWKWVFAEAIKTKSGANRRRWENAAKDKAIARILDRPLLKTMPEEITSVLVAGTVSTNVYLRRVHNLALDMCWLPRPIILKRQWPKIKHKDARAITIEEHRLILSAERNPERHALYQMCWHLGGGQSDMACLKAEYFDRKDKTLTYWRMKTGSRCQMRYGSEVEELLEELPQTGPLFPYLSGVREADRATEFKQRCDALGIKGVTLHSYRYAWAERAKAAGYPERYAQLALGHGSKAVARAYARKADVCLPSLQEFEEMQAAKIIPMQQGSVVLTSASGG